VLDELPWLFSCACRRWVVQRHSQVNLDRRPSDSHLLDQQTYQLLTLLEIECIDAGSNASCEGFDLASQALVDREVLSVGQNRLAFEFELSMAADHVLVACLELRELDRLHLIEVRDSAPFALGVLESTLQACELHIQQFIVGLCRSSAESRLALHQDRGLKERLSNLVPHQGV
jgi:hypothetical protein